MRFLLLKNTINSIFNTIKFRLREFICGCFYNSFIKKDLKSFLDLTIHRSVFEILPFSSGCINAKCKLPRNESVLVIAPHPDDELIGLGGTIQLLREKNCKVHVVYVTTGQVGKKDKIRKEATSVCSLLGIQYTFLSNNPSEIDLSEGLKVEKMIRKLKIRHLFTTFVMDDHDDHKDHDDHDDHGSHDPHAWLSPENAKLWLNIIASKLSVSDPENAATYFMNAAAGQAEIEAMIAEVKATLKPVQGGKFVVFHDAYQYFENDFDFYASGAISLGDSSDPSPARIEKVQKRIRDEGIQCVLAEPQFKKGLVATVMEGSDATASVIDPLGTELEAGPKLYTQLIKNMAKTLRNCL